MGFFSLRQWLNRKSRRPQLAPLTRSPQRFRKLALENLEERLAPAAFVWDGGVLNGLSTGGDGVHWSDPNNWVGGVAPTGSAATLDNLTFGTQAPNNRRSPVNDLAVPGGQTQVVFNSISVSDPTGPGVNPYNLSGNAVTLGSTSSPGSGFITINAGSLGTVISMNVTLGGPPGSNQFFTVNNAASLTLSGQLSGTTGSTFTKEGVGILTLTADNSGFTGQFQVDNNAGIVNIQNANALGSSNTTVVGSGSQLQVQNAAGMTVTEPLTLNGLGINNQGALQNVAGANVWAGNIVLASNVALGALAGKLTISGQISDLGSGFNLTKEGDAQIIFNNPAGNTYRGLTTINDGILTIEDPLSLGLGGTPQSGTIVNRIPGPSGVAATGTLQLLFTNNLLPNDPDGIVANPNLPFNATTNPYIGFQVRDENLTLNGPGFGGVGGNGALTNIQGDNNWAGPVTLGSPAPNSVAVSIGVAAPPAGSGATSSTLTISGIISDGPAGPVGLTKVDVGELIFNNANTYTDTVTVADGILDVRDSGALGLGASAVTVDVGAALNLEVDNGFDAHGRDLSIDSVTGINGNGPQLGLTFSRPLTLNGSGVLIPTHVLVFDIASGTQSDQILTPYSGALHSISGINIWGAPVASLPVPVGGGDITLGGAATMDAIGVEPDPNPSPTNDYFTHDYSLTIYGSISGPAISFAKVGAGQLILAPNWKDATGVTRHDNPYTGIIFIDQGWITTRYNLALGDLQSGLGDTVQSPLYVANGAALHLKPYPGQNINLDKNLVLSGEGIGYPSTTFGLIDQKGALMSLGGENTIGNTTVVDPGIAGGTPTTYTSWIKLAGNTGIGVENPDPQAPQSELAITAPISDLQSYTFASGLGSPYEDPVLLPTLVPAGQSVVSWNFPATAPPNDLRVYYPPFGRTGSVLDFDTTPVSTPGTQTVPYPGTSTVASNVLEVDLNQGGGGGGSWSYSVTVIPTNPKGGITKFGSQRLDLQGPGSFTGSNIVAEGVLRVQNDTALGQQSSGTGAGNQVYTTTQTTVQNGATLELKAGLANLNGGIAAGVQVRNEHLVLNNTGSASVQTATITVANNTTFTLTYAGQTTAPFTFSSTTNTPTALQIQAALLTLPAIGATQTLTLPLVTDLPAGTTQFTLAFNGVANDPVQHPLSLTSMTLAADIQGALNALSTIGGVGGGVTVVQSPLNPRVFTITFGGSLGQANPAPLAFAVIENGKSVLMPLQVSAGFVNVAQAANVYTISFQGRLVTSQNLLTGTPAAGVTTNAGGTLGGAESPLVNLSDDNVWRGPVTLAQSTSIQVASSSRLSLMGVIDDQNTTNPTGQVQTLTLPTVTGSGTFTLTFNGVTTSAINFNSPTLVSDITNSLNSPAMTTISGVGASVTVAATPNPLVFTLTFGGTLAGMFPPLITAKGNGGADPTVVSAGSDLTFLTGPAPLGATVADYLAGKFPGELVLGGSNTYRGVTHVGLSTAYGDAVNAPGGILTIENDQALGAITGGTQVANGSTLQIQGNLSIAGEPLTIQGSGVGAPPSNVPIQWFNIGPAPENNNPTNSTPVVDPSLVNEPVSGRVTGVAVDPTDPNVIYIATAGGGAWKTIDKGLTWHQMFDSVPTVQSVTVTGLPSGTFTLTFNGSKTIALPATATAAQVQAALNALPSISNVIGTPGDTSGSAVSVTQSGTISALPGGGFTSTVYTIAFQGALAATFSTAALGTTATPGTTATAAIVANGVTATGINLAMFTGAIAIAPSDPHVIYIGTGEADNSADSFYGTGVYRSIDSGQTWTLVYNNVDKNTPTMLVPPSLASNPLYALAVSKIVVDPNDPLLIYVATGDQEANQPPLTIPSPIPGIYRFDEISDTWYCLTGAMKGEMPSDEVSTIRENIMGQQTFIPMTPGPDDDFRIVFPQGPNSLYATVGGNGANTVGPATWTDLSLTYVDIVDPRTGLDIPYGGLPPQPVLYAALGNYDGSVNNAVFRTLEPGPPGFGYTHTSSKGAPPVWHIGDPGIPMDEIIQFTIPQGGGVFALTFKGVQYPAAPPYIPSDVTLAAFTADVLKLVQMVEGMGATVTVTETTQNPQVDVFTIEFGVTPAPVPLPTDEYSPEPLFGIIPLGVMPTEMIIQNAGGADTEWASEFPNAFSALPGTVTAPAPRNGNIKFSVFTSNTNPLNGLGPTLDQITIFASIAYPEDFGVYPIVAGQLREIQESIPAVPTATGGGGFNWGAGTAGAGGQVPIATPASFPGTNSTGYMGVNKPETGTAPPTSLAMGWYASDLLIPSGPGEFLGASPNEIFVGSQETTGPAGTTPGVGDIYVSNDGGVTWTDISNLGIGGPKTGVHSLVFNNLGQVVAGSDGGVWVYDNTTNPASPAWINANGDLSISLVNSASPNPIVPGSAIVGLQANGVAVSDGSSAAWVHTDVPDLSGGPVAFDPKNPNIAYAVNVQDTGILLTPFGPVAVGDGFLDKSTDGGNTWTSLSGTLPGQLPIYQSSPLTIINPLITLFFPILVDPVNDSRLLVGGTDVIESLNGGTTWQGLGTGLVTITAFAAASYQGTFQPDPKFSQVGDKGTNTYDPDTVYAVGLDAFGVQHVLVTKNHGLTWVDRTPAGPTIGNIISIAVDPSNENTAYVVTNAWGGNRILETKNGGQTWVNVTGTGATALPALPSWAVVVDGRTGTVYVGNDNGVWVATGGGNGAMTSWQRFGAGLPYVQVTSLVLTPALNTLTAGTYGRGVYQLSLSNVPSSPLTGNTYGALLAASGDSIWNGPIYLAGDPTNNTAVIAAAGTQALADGVSTASLTIFGSISDLTPGSNTKLNKVGQGDVVLSGTNTYGGVTELMDGQVIVHDPRALGASTIGPNDVQIVSVSGTGTFSLAFNGQSTPTSGPNVLNAADPTLAADMQSALNALTSIGGVMGAVSVTKTANGYMVYFGGSLAGSRQPLLISTILTGTPTVVVNENTYSTEVQGITFTGPVNTFSLGFNGQNTGPVTATGPLNYSSTIGATTSTIGATISAIAPYPAGANEVGNLVTIMTTTPHDLVVGQSVIIGGVNLSGYTGTYVVTSVPTPTTFTYIDAANAGLPAAGGGSVTPVVYGANETSSGRTIVATNGAVETTLAATVAATNGATETSSTTTVAAAHENGSMIAIAAANGATEVGNTVTITTAAPHGFAVGQTVVINNVGQLGYNGNYVITAVPTPTSFTYQSNTAGLPASGGGTAAVNTVTIMTTAPHGYLVGQTIVLAGIGAAGYNGTFTVTSVPTPTTFTYTPTASGLPFSGGGTSTVNTVTITTTVAHGYVAGESVVLANIGVAGYNGTFTITSVPSLTTFTYTIGAPGLAASGGGTANVNIVTITTSAAHGFTPGETAVISGVGESAYNGTFTILSVPTGTTFTYSEAATGLAASGGGMATVNTVTITTTTPHDLVAGQAITIAGVLPVTAYNGSFTVASVPTPTSFTYTVPTAGLAPAGGGSVTPLIFGASETGPATIANSPGGAIENTSTATIIASPGGAVENTTTAAIVASPGGIIESGTTVTVTLTTTTSAAGLAVGDTVVISGVPVTGYDGTFVITALPTPTSFTYTNIATGLTPSAGGTVTLNTVTITTSAAHGFAVGQTVVIGGVAVAGYNGAFTITAASSTTFAFTTAQTGLAASGGGTATVNTVTITTTGAHGFAVGQTVVIGNAGVTGYDGTFVITSVPSPTTFTYTTTQKGLLPSGGGSAVDNTVTITTTTAHGFVPGQVVTISGVPVLPYDGTFTILSVPTPTSFTFTDNASALPSSGGGTVTLAPVSTAAVIQNALNGLASIGGLTPVPGSVTVTPSATGYVVVFGGSLADAKQANLITAASLPASGITVNEIVAGGQFGGTIVDAGTPVGTTPVDPIDLGLKSDLQDEPVQLNGNGGVFNGHFTGALQNISNNNTYTGTLVLNANSVIGVDSGTTLTIGTKAPILTGIGTVTDNGTNKSLTKELSGTLILGSANTYGGVTEVNQGVLEVENSLALGGTTNGTDVFNGAQLQLQTPPAQTVTVTGTAGTFTLQFNNQITHSLPFNASADMVQAALNALTSISSVGGAAAVTLSGNVYTVTFTGNLGGANQPPLIAVGSGGATAVVGPSAGTPVVVVNEPLTLAGTGINGTGALLDSGGNNTWQGPIMLTPNDLVLVQASGALTSPAVAASLAPGVVAVGTANAGDVLTINGPIGQTTDLGLSKVGAGTVVLQQADSYTGTTYVQQGILNVQNAAALGAIATPDLQRITVYGPATGTFTLTFKGQKTVTLPSTGTLDTIAASTLATQIKNALNALPAITAAGGVNVLPATAIPNLTGNNFTVTFNSPNDEPPITITATGNAVGFAGIVADGTVGTLVSTGATLQVQGTPATIAAAPGGATESGTTVTITTSAAHGLTPGQKVTIAGVPVGGYNGTFTVLTAPTLTTFTYAAVAGLTPSGGGTATPGLTMLAEPLTLFGPGNNSVGALQSSGGYNTWTGTVSLQTDSSAQGQYGPSIGVDPGLQLIVSGTVQDPLTPPTPPVPAASLFKVGNGQLVFPNANTYSGLTLVTAGDLNVENPSALGAGNPEVQTITVLGANGSFALKFMGQTTPPLNINPPPPATLAGNIQNALNQILSTLAPPYQGGHVTVTQGTGSSSNVYTVNFGGLLAFGNMPQLVSIPGAGVLATVATVQDGPSGTFVNPSVNQVVNVTGTGTFALAFNGQSTPTGALALPANASATQVAAALNALSNIQSDSNNGLASSVTVTSPSAGVYVISFHGGWSEDIPPLFVASGFGGATATVSLLVGASLQVQGSINVSSEALHLGGPGFNNAGALESVSGNNGWVNASPSPIPLDNTIFLGGNTTIGADNGSTLTINQTIFDSGLNYGLTKVGIGTVVFTGSTSNSYGGGTTVNDGTLQLNKSFGITAASVSAGGTGYNFGDILTLQGGTFSQAAQLMVTSVGSGGVVTGVQIIVNGAYTVLPANPVSVTDATTMAASGATFNLTALQPLAIPGNLTVGDATLPVPIAPTPNGATESGSVVTITTTAVHGLVVGQTVIINNVGVAGYNGTFTIASVPTPTTFTYADIMNTGLAPSGGGTVVAPNNFQPIATTANNGATESGNVVTIATQAPHGLVIGQTVLVEGVAAAGYDGIYTIASVPSATTFTYINSSSGLPASGGGFVTDVETVQLEQSNQLPSTAKVVVNSDGLFEFNAPPVPPRPIVVSPGGATESGSTVTITTQVPHGLVVGQGVIIGNVGVMGYNGTFTITSVLSPTKFTYTTTNTGLVPSGGGTVSPVNIEAIAAAPNGATETGNTVTITTTTTHSLVIGQNVIVAGFTGAAAGYNGTFTVTSTPTPTTFTYTDSSASGLPNSGGGTVSPTVVQTLATLTMHGGFVNLQAGQLTLTGDSNGVVVNGTSDANDGTAMVIDTNDPLGVGNMILATPGANATFNVTGPGATSGLPDMTIQPVIAGQGQGVTKTGNGTLQLTAANTYTGTTTIKAGNVQVDGPSGTIGAVILAGGALSGTGTVGAITAGTLTQPSTFSTVSPGDGGGPGLLTATGNVAWNNATAPTVFAVDLASATSYSALSVNGTVDLTNASLAITVAAGYTPKVTTTSTTGDQFTIITSTGDITGMFTNEMASADTPAKEVIFVGNLKFQVIITNNGPTHTVVLQRVPIVTSVMSAEAPATGFPNTVYTITVTITPEPGASGPFAGTANITVAGPGATSQTFTGIPVMGTTATKQLQGVPVGVYTVTSATYVSSDPGFLGSTTLATNMPGFTVSKDNTTITTPVLVAPHDSNPSVYSEPVTFQVTVQPVTPGGPVGSLPPGGTVNFYDGAVNTADLIGTATVNASTGFATLTIPSASATIAFLSLGGHTISAVYQGDSNYFASPQSGSLAQSVNVDGSTISVHSTNVNAAYGGATITATVAAATPGVGKPPDGEMVTFAITGTRFDGTTITPITEMDALTGGVATLQQVLLPGMYVINASYPGDTNYTSSDTAGVNPLSQTINKVASMTTLHTTVANSGAYGQVLITATVAQQGTGPNPGPVTGTVTFHISVNGTSHPDVMGTVIGGVATLDPTQLPVNAMPYTISASYSGDNNYATSVSPNPPLMQTITKADTQTTLNVTAGQTIQYGQAVFASVAPKLLPAVTAPMGTVTFTITPAVGPALGPVTLANGMAPVPAANLIPGQYMISASYSNSDGNFNDSNSGAAISFTVSKSNSSVTVSSTPPSPSGTGIVTITATVGSSGTGATPTGTVTFKNGTTTIKSGAMLTNGIATYTTTAGQLQTGSNTILVSYSGDPFYNPGDNTPGYTLIVDMTPPTTTITAKPPAFSNSTTANFTFSGSDNVTPPTLLKFQYRLDSTSGPFTLLPSNTLTLSSLTAGGHAIQVEAIDQAGNIDTTGVSYSWTIDLTPPTTSILTGPSVPPALNNHTSATFTFTGSDNVTSAANLTFQYTLNGGAATPATSPLTVTARQGNNVLIVQAIDQAGNIDPTGASYTWNVDSIAPTTMITGNPATLTNHTTATFTWTGTDNTGGSGLASFQYSLDNATPVNTTNTTVTFSKLLQGPHTFLVQAIDHAGNVDPTGAKFSWTVNLTLPSTSFTGPLPPLFSNSTSATFSFAGTENFANPGTFTFQYSLDGQAKTPTTSPLTLTNLMQGAHTFLVQAIDGAGNVDPTGASYSWTVDTTPPTTSFTGQLPPQLSNSSSAVFTFTGTDNITAAGSLTYKYSLDSGPLTTATFNPLTVNNLNTGAHTFLVKAVDQAGNIDPVGASYTWNVNVTPPVATILPVSTPTPSPVSTITITFNEAVTGFTVSSLRLSFNGGATNLLTGSQTLSAADSTNTKFTLSNLAGLTVSKGTYTLTLTALGSGIKDSAGNVLAANATMSWQKTVVDSIVGRNLANAQWTVAQNGLATQPYVTDWPTQFTWLNVVTGNFDGLGKAEVAGRSSQTGQWYVSVPNGSGGYITKPWGLPWAAIVNWKNVVVGDFNGDGRDDIAGQEGSSGRWWVAISTGSSFNTSFWGSWSPETAGTLDWANVLTGDFNGDGRTDIAGRIKETGAWYVQVSNGVAFQAQLWGQWSPDTSTFTWTNVLAGDFNGDGKTDIAGRVLQTGAWFVNQSTGSRFNTVFWDQWSADIPGTFDWVDVKAGDFNGDGKADIVGRVKESGQWYVAESTGTTFKTTLWQTWSRDIPGSFDWVDVQVGDFNGDGKDDIVGRVKETGAWFVSLSNAGPKSAYFLPPSVYSSWDPSINWVDVHKGNFI
jgi:autotransporter-associated beta strand protein